MASVLVAMAVLVAVVIAVIVWKTVEIVRSYKGMKALGYEDGPKPLSDWYKPSNTCRECRSRIGNECRVGQPMEVVTVDAEPLLLTPGMPVVVVGGEHWPRVRMGGTCKLWQPDYCPSCRGTKFIVATRRDSRLGIDTTTKWWKWCAVCERTGRMKH